MQLVFGGVAPQPSPASVLVKPRGFKRLNLRFRAMEKLGWLAESVDSEILGTAFWYVLVLSCRWQKNGELIIKQMHYL